MGRFGPRANRARAGPFERGWLEHRGRGYTIDEIPDSLAWLSEPLGWLALALVLAELWVLPLVKLEPLDF